MREFFGQYGGSIIVGLVVLAIIAFALIKTVRDKRKGKSSCGCNCAGCPNSCHCHTKGKKQ